MQSPTLVDSNVFIGLFRQGLDPIAELTARVSKTDLATCGMVRLEVIRGLSRPTDKARIAAFLDVMQNVTMTNRLWEEATELAWVLDRKGRVIPAQDIVIAASALRIGAELLTNDQHFSVVPGLRVRRWP